MHCALHIIITRQSTCSLQYDSGVSKISIKRKHFSSISYFLQALYLWQCRKVWNRIDNPLISVILVAFWQRAIKLLSSPAFMYPAFGYNVDIFCDVAIANSRSRDPQRPTQWIRCESPSITAWCLYATQDIDTHPVVATLLCLHSLILLQTSPRNRVS